MGGVGRRGAKDAENETPKGSEMGRVSLVLADYGVWGASLSGVRSGASAAKQI